MWAGRARSRPATRARREFLLRMLLTVGGVALVLGAAAYFVQAGQATRFFLADGTAHLRAQARAVETAYATAGNSRTAWVQVRQTLALAKSVAGAEHVLVLLPSGRTVAAADPSDEGRQHDGPEVQSVLRTGTVSVEPEDHDGRRMFAYIARISLGGAPYAYEVELQPVVLDQQIAALRIETLRRVGIGVLLAFPLLYLLGGRKLAARFGEVQERATRDGLTGLGNFQAFQDALSRETARAQRYGEPLALALIDLDDFKAVNDTFGHQRGDEVLVALAATLRSGRELDLAYRIGGDEFAVILEHTEIGDAVVAIERLRRAALPRLDGVTLSVGVAGHRPGRDAAALRSRADFALYEAKRRGRDQSVAADEGLLISSAGVSADSSDS